VRVIVLLVVSVVVAVVILGAALLRPLSLASTNVLAVLMLVLMLVSV